MSLHALTWLAGVDPGLVKPGPFRVLFHLCNHHNADEVPAEACFPSQKHLRERTGMANGTLNTALHQLEDAGLMRRLRTTADGAKTRRTYFLLGCDMGAGRPGNSSGAPEFVEASGGDQTPNSGPTNSGGPEFDPVAGAEQTPVSGASNSGGPEPDRAEMPEQTPVSGVSNSGFDPIKLRPTGDQPVSNRKEQDCVPEAVVAAAFERFLAGHPRVRDRHRCLVLFRDAVADGEDPERIASAASAYAAENAGNEARFVQYSDRWLAARRWRDHAEAAVAAPAPAPRPAEPEGPVFVPVTSRGAVEWEEAFEMIAGTRLDRVVPREDRDGVAGRWLPSAWPPADRGRRVEVVREMCDGAAASAAVAG